LPSEGRTRQPRSSRPTRYPSVARLVDAAERALAFYRQVTENETVQVISEIPFEPNLSGRLIRESMQTVKIAAGGAIYNMINQDLTYRVPVIGAVTAFKQGFFVDSPGVSTHFIVRAFERDGHWESGGELPFVDPTVDRYILEASDVKIGTAYPGVAPATCYLLLDRTAVLEGPERWSIVVHFLNPYQHDGCFPPYVDAFGRYGIVDHRDGTATVEAYWVGSPGGELMEPMLRETKPVKALHSMFEDGTKRLVAAKPLGKVVALPLLFAGFDARLAASLFGKLGDLLLGITGLRRALWRLLADRHNVFYERDWCNPDRWLKVGESPVSTSGEARQDVREQSAQEFADRAWREVRGSRRQAEGAS
jgi:hypothetical protein